VDAAAVRARLATVGLRPDRIDQIEGGWASWTFELDESLIVRFPRNTSVQEAMHRELRLLPALAARVSFAVPVPLHVGDGWFVYEKIRGRPFRRGDDLDGARAMIDELHAFPAEEAARILQRPTWREALARQWERFEEVVLPLLDGDLADEVREAFAPSFDFEPALVHDDLGLEHLLVDDSGAPVGIIDFEDATVGDPEVDFVPLHAELGLPMSPRMAFYRWKGSLHALEYYREQGMLGEIGPAIAELRRRLDARSGR